VPIWVPVAGAVSWTHQWGLRFVVVEQFVVAEFVVVAVVVVVVVVVNIMHWLTGIAKG